MEENNVFLGKSVEEATQLALETLGITQEQAEITVLDEGKKKLFGGVKARVKVTKKESDSKRAADFVDAILNILKISAVCEICNERDNSIVLDVKTTNTARVIGKHGDILDSIQTLAGAVANIGKEEYKKVVVDCEGYRLQREQTLKELAEKLAKKAVEKGRKMILEPMSPYERRIIHAALSENTEVKTVSEGKEPKRYIAVVPNNLKTYENTSFGERRSFNKNRSFNRDRSFSRDTNKFDRKPRTDGEKTYSERTYGDKPRFSKPFAQDGENRTYNNRYNNRRSFGESGERRSFNRTSAQGTKAKREIHFGSYLGNSGAKKEDNNSDD